MHQLFCLWVDAARDVAVVLVSLSGVGMDLALYCALDVLWGKVIPTTINTIPNAKVGVTNQTAGSKDFNDSMKSHLPIVFSFVLATTFMLLLVTFHSIVIPLTTIGLNLLSVETAYGVLVLVFQHK